MASTIEIIPADVNKNSLMTYSKEQDTTEDLLYEFLKDRTPMTARSYRQDLKSFFEFTRKFFNLPHVEGDRAHFEDIRRVHIVKFKNYLESTPSKLGKPYAPLSINRKLSSVSSFYQFLLQREIIDKNPAEFCIRPKRIVIRETEAFNEKEMRQFFELVMRRANPLHKSILLLLFTTGMRNNEARSIKLNDFELRDGVKVLRYVGKGQKINVVPIHPATSHALGHYVEWMKKQGRQITSDDYFFQASKITSKETEKNKLSHTALGYIVKKWAQKINMSKRITPHSARASFISCLLESGEDIYTVAKCVNHADVRTTARYDKRKQNFHKSPVFNLNFF